MPRFLIERKIPGMGEFNAQQLQALSQKSTGVLGDMQRHGTAIQWDQSYVAGNTLHCVYVAPSEEAIREHARNGGFPCDTITEIVAVIDPTTAE